MLQRECGAAKIGRMVSLAKFVSFKLFGLVIHGQTLHIAYRYVGLMLVDN